MRKPNLDDYDNGYQNLYEVLRYPMEENETKEERAKRRMQLFLQVWEDRRREDGRRYSDVSGKRLPERFSTLYFDHLLERSKYPEFEFDAENIALCLPEEHYLKTNGNPLPKHKDLIEEAKERFKIL